MGRMRSLSRKYLESIGVCDVSLVDGKWIVTRRYKTKSGGVITSTVSPRPNNGSLAVILSIDGRSTYTSFPRMLYAWRHGSISSDEEAVLSQNGEVVKLSRSEAHALRRRR